MNSIEPGFGNDMDLALLRIKELLMALEAIGRGDEPDGDVVVALAEVIGEKVSYAEELLEKERRERRTANA